MLLLEGVSIGIFLQYDSAQLRRVFERENWLPLGEFTVEFAPRKKKKKMVQDIDWL